MQHPISSSHETPNARAPTSRTGRWFGLLALVWCGLIFASSSTVILPHDFFAWIAAHVLPDEQSLESFVMFWGVSWFAIVKSWHAIEFGIVFWLILAVANRLSVATPRRNFAIAVALSILFAISDEYHQTFVPERGGTWIDVGIDTIGIFLAAAIAARRFKVSPNPR